jgi:hypothetical protein
VKGKNGKYDFANTMKKLQCTNVVDSNTPEGRIKTHKIC